MISAFEGSPNAPEATMDLSNQQCTYYPIFICFNRNYKGHIPSWFGLHPKTNLYGIIIHFSYRAICFNILFHWKRQIVDRFFNLFFQTLILRRIVNRHVLYQWLQLLTEWWIRELEKWRKVDTIWYSINKIFSTILCDNKRRDLESFHFWEKWTNKIPVTQL